MPIYRIPILVTVLIESSGPDQAQSYLETCGLARIAEEIDLDNEGELAGSYVIGEAEALAGEEIARALMAVGEAPTFFDDE